MPPGEGIRLELVEESELSGGGTRGAGPPAPLPRDRQLRQAGRTAWKSRSAATTARSLADRAIGKVFVPRHLASCIGYFRDEESTARLPVRRRLARHRRHGLHVGRLHLHRRPRQGHDHHQRPQPLAAGHRMGGRAAARLQVRRHRRLRDHRPVGRGNAGGARPLPRVAIPSERGRLRDDIRERVRAITGITPVVELVPPRTLPRTSSGKLSRTKARNLYLSRRDPALTTSPPEPLCVASGARLIASARHRRYSSACVEHRSPKPRARAASSPLAPASLGLGV